MSPETPVAPAIPAPRRARSLPRTVRKVARVLVLAWVGWCAIIWFAQADLLYLPAQAGPGLPAARVATVPRLERLRIAQDDGQTTEAWLVRTPSERRRGLAVFFHGNAELIDDNLAEADRWNERGFDALLPEYRGYGRTSGTPSEARLVEDALAAIRAVRPGAADPLVLHGRSLGTGIATQVAARLERAAPAALADGSSPEPLHATAAASEPSALRLLVLESPFTSIASFAWGFGVPPILVRDTYRTDLALGVMRCPVVALGARDDSIVPIEHGRALAALHARVQLVELEGDHNSGLSGQAGYWVPIDAALRAVDP